MEQLSSLAKNQKMATGVGIGTSITLGSLAAYYMYKRGKKGVEESESEVEQEDRTVVALLGDVGGTNVRLTLRRLNMTTRTSTEIKPLTRFDAQKEQSFKDCVTKFLSVSWLGRC